MTGLLFNNVSYILGCKPEEIIINRLDWAWMANGATNVKLSFPKQNIKGILFLSIAVMGDGSGVPFNIVDDRNGDIIWNDFGNIYQIADNRNFYYFIPDSSFSFTVSQPGVTLGFNYAKLTFETHK